jgi:hypothetical protein
MDKKKKIIIIILAIIILALASFVVARFFLSKKTNSKNTASKKISSVDLAKYGESANFTVDFSQEEGKFSGLLFTGFDKYNYEENGYQLLASGGFKNISVSDSQFNLEKAKSLAAKNMRVVMHINASRYETEGQLRARLEAIFNSLEEIKKIVPSLNLKTFVFANEPDMINSMTWRGTEDQLFEDYGYFAKFIKSKNPEYAVGGLGFTNAYYDKNKKYISDFVAYAAKNNLPLDFVDFHGYDTEVKHFFSEGAQNIIDILEKYPNLSPLFGKTKIAVTELDIYAFPIPCPPREDFSELDSVWRAAHNTLTKMAMVEKGTWMIFEVTGPYSDPTGEACPFWKKSDGSLKPIYYAYQAFNKLFDQVKLETTGSNFETYGITAGKSVDGKELAVVIANYDETQFLNMFPKLVERLSPLAKVFGSWPRQSADTLPAKQFEIIFKNLPWTAKDTIKIETYLVDDTHNMELVDTKTEKGAAEIVVGQKTNLPEVRLIKITKN